MRRRGLVAVLAVAVFCLLAPAARAADPKFHLALDLIPADAPAPLLEAKALYEQRDGTGQHARKMLEVLDPYLKEHPDDFNALILSSMACFWVCDRTTDEAVKRDFGKRGYEYAERAIRVKPDHAAGHYYYTINLGEYGLGISILKALAQGLDKNYREHGTRALQLDPAFEAGGPDRALGRFYHKLPWPKYDAKKSEEHLRRSIEAFPGKIRSYYYLVDTLAKEKRYAEARKVGQDALAAEAYEWDLWEDEFYRGEIRKQLAQIEGK